MRELLLITVSILLIFPTVYPVDHTGRTAEKIHQPNIEIQQEADAPPILSVIKKAGKEEVKWGNEASITIIIQNHSNSTAFNVTLKESKLPQWAFRVEGNLTVSWNSPLKPGQEVSHKYYLSPKLKSTKEVSLGRANVTWRGSGGKQYRGFSEDVLLEIKYPAREGVNWEKVWKNGLFLVAGIVFLTLAPLIFIEFRTLKEYKEVE